MIKKLAVAIIATLVGTTTYAEDVPITGLVTSKCVIHTDVPGVYGNPTPNVLSTAQADGGVQPIIRYDVVQGGYYKAAITTPTAFSSSPSLSDSVTWTGEITVGQVSDAGMSVYTTNKRVYNTTSEFDLTIPGTVWFKGASRAEYGSNKSFPAGTYRSIIIAECIAK